MPKVLERDGFQFYIYYNDHIPSHVHVKKAGGEVILQLGDAETKPSIREVRGMSFTEVKRALAIAAREQQHLRKSWTRIHG
jgi:hypothetical protein